MPLPEPGNPSRSGSNFSSPNFSLNTGKLSEKPREQIGIDHGPEMSEKAYRPLQKTSSQEGTIPSLADPGMSKPVLDKYPTANEIAAQNSSFPVDFKSEMDPVRRDFSLQSLDQRDQAKNAIFQEVNQVKFESLENVNKNLKTRSESKIQELTNPEVQADYFTSSAKDALPGNFFSRGELSPSNVFSQYNSNTAEYGKGEMPQTKESSALMSQKSAEAAKIASPQRAADSLSNSDGKSSFKGDSIPRPEANVNTGIKDTVLSSLSAKDSMQGGKNNALSSSEVGKSFFVSNFTSVGPGISGAINNSSSNTSNAETQISSNT